MKVIFEPAMEYDSEVWWNKVQMHTHFKVRRNGVVSSVAAISIPIKSTV